MCLFLSGVAASLFATFIGWLGTWTWQIYNNKRLYNGIEGKFVEHVLGTRENPYAVNEESTARTLIKYNKNNILSIKTTEKNGLVWEGIISMQTATSGTISWHYPNFKIDNIKEKMHNFGTKHLIFPSPNIIYLSEDTTGEVSNLPMILVREETAKKVSIN